MALEQAWFILKKEPATGVLDRMREIDGEIMELQSKLDKLTQERQPLLVKLVQGTYAQQMAASKQGRFPWFGDSSPNRDDFFTIGEDGEITPQGPATEVGWLDRPRPPPPWGPSRLPPHNIDMGGGISMRYDPENRTEGQQSLIDRATKNLREQQEGEGGE